MKMDDLDPDIQLGQHPLAFSAKANAEDTPTFKEAMDIPDAEGFTEVMKIKLDQLEGMDAWDVVPREKAFKAKKRIIALT
jgi:hypothetical protein